MAVIIDYAAVALLAASSVGEELISIPAGWALGLPLWNVVAAITVKPPAIIFTTRLDALL